MRTNHYFKWMTIVVVAVAACVGGYRGLAQDALEERPQELLEWAAALMERLSAAMHGRIVLSGTAVNSAGQPLSGVTLEVEKARIIDWSRTDYSTETYLVNGAFHIDVSGYAAVRLSFEKEGYQTKVLEFGMPMPVEAVQRAVDGFEVGPFTFQKDDIRVEMPETGTVAELAEYNEVLEYAVSGEAVVIDFDGLPGSATVRVTNVTDPSQLPSNSVYMIADQAAGQIAVTALPRPDSDVVDIVPTSLTLRMRDASDGFVRFVPEPGSDGFTQMTSAPISGYQNALMLEAQDFPGGGQRHGVLFYFKNKDNYGKGWAGAVRVNDGRSEVRLVTAFEVQTDGSRHLDTGSDPVVNTVVLEGPIDTGDSVPPQISCPSDVTATCAGLEGSKVTFAAPTAVDETDPNPRVVLSHESSSRFPVGTTTVTATAFDAHGNSASCTFTVTVQDTTPPQISCPANITVTAENSSGAVVTFAPSTATDGCDPNPVVTLSHASGSVFPVGVTTVTATATDASGNASSCSFTITVQSAESPIVLSYLPPIKPLIENVVKVNQTIPVKVDARRDGAVVPDLAPEIRLVLGNYTEANPDIEQEITVTSTSKADTTGIMRWSDADGHYIYNLSTKGLKTGQNYTVLVRLRNQAGAVVSEVRALLLMKK